MDGLASIAEVEEPSTRGDLGLPLRGPWASCPPRRLSLRGWSLRMRFPLSSFADDLGFSPKVSGVFGHAPRFVADLPAVKFSVPT